jgi:hypothetical protein
MNSEDSSETDMPLWNINNWSSVGYKNRLLKNKIP